MKLSASLFLILFSSWVGADTCLDNYLKGLKTEEQVPWNKLEDISSVPGLSHDDAMVLRVYLHSVPHNLRQRLLTKFKGQPKEATLRDLEAMRDLHRINGGCK